MPFGFINKTKETAVDPSKSSGFLDVIEKIKPFLQIVSRGSKAVVQPFQETEDILFGQTPFKQVRSFLKEIGKEQKEFERSIGIDFPGPAFGFDVGTLEKV